MSANQVRVVLEDSWMDPAAAALGSQATIETTSVGLSTAVASGKPLVLERVAQPGGSRGAVELMVEPQ